MANGFTCDDKATLISYVYGEVDDVTRRAVEEHLAQCSVCADEVTALGDVRSELSLWVAPDAELDFTLVKKSELGSSNVLRPAAWWKTVPAWAQAAAAILVIAAGASIANLQIRSGPEGFSVTTGWMQPDPIARVATDRDTVGRDLDAMKVQLASLEQQLRDEVRASRTEGVTLASTSSQDAATLREVRQLIADAERRHSQELATRFVEFANDMTLQRRADMQNISRVMNSYDAQMLRQRQYLNNINNMIRVTNAPQQ